MSKLAARDRGAGVAAPPALEKEYPQHRFSLPPGATDLWLIRHGESAPARPSQPFQLVDGHEDPPLAPDGHEQAQRVAERLAHERFDAIYVTTLQRTVQTAAPLAAALGLAPRVVPGLREVGLGDWEGGLFRALAAEEHPIAQRLFSEERWDVIPNAEPAGAFAERVRTAIEGLAREHPGQRLAVFTHGGVIGQALCLASKSSGFAFVGADNASISQIVVAHGHWIIRRFNDTAHLVQAASLQAAPLV